MNIAAQRFVFNLYRGQFMPVAEIARRHGKGRLAGHSGKIDIALTATLDAARDLNLASLATSEYQSLDLKKKDLAWQSVKGSGTQDETTRYTRLTAGQIQISAGNRITADMSVKDSAQILANEPGMDWLKQIQEDPRLNSQIDWNPIEEAHRKWDYDQQGLTPAAAVVVAIVVTWLTAGAAAEAGAAVVNGAAGAGAATAGGGAVAATMVQVGITTLASQASVSLINNQGDIGATLHELGSQENLRQLAIAMVTAGALKGIGDTLTIDGKALNTITVKDGFAANAGKNLINGLARATLTSAVTGTDLETSLRTEVIASILNAASAQGANWIGDQAQTGQINEFGRAFAHAVAGCMAGAAGASAPGSNTGAGSGCGAGALGAVVGELSAGLYNSGRAEAGLLPKTDTVAFASMMGGIAAAVAGQDAQGIAIASSTGANAAENNYLKHQEILDIAKARKECNGGAGSAAACGEVKRLEALDKQRDVTLAACEGDNSTRCTNARQEVRTAYAEIIRKSDEQFGLIAPRPLGYDLEARKTKYEADKTISNLDRAKGGVIGLGTAIIDGLVGIAKGGIIYVKAVAGNEEAGEQLGKAVDGVIGLASSPELWEKVLTNATQEQHAKIADAYEKGDGVALGKIAGEVLSNLVGGGIGTVGKAGKAAAAEDLANVAKDVEKAGAGRVISTTTWQTADALRFNPAEANKQVLDRLPTGAKVESGAVDALNKNSTAKGYDPSYLPNTQAYTYTTTTNDKFVRVYSIEGNNQVGGWMMRESDIAGLSPAQIKDKFALPQMPSYVTDVVIPPGRTMRASTANNIMGNSGGGVQFEVVSKPATKEEFATWFDNSRPLK